MYCPDQQSLTVVIPHYNRWRMLRRALNSIANQSLLPNQVIVVDDGSTDEHFQHVVDLCDGFSGDLSLKILRNDRNRGANYCRNIAINAAESQYVSFLDSDDFWFPQKIAKQMKEIHLCQQTDRGAVLSFTGRYRVNGEGAIIARQFGGKLMETKNIKQVNFIGPLSSVIVDTELARQIDGFNELLPACQDWDFFIRASEHAQIVAVPDPLCVYVDHSEDRISNNHRERLMAILYIYANYGRHNKDHRSAYFMALAEEYEELGRLDRAKKLYSASLSSTGTHSMGESLSRSLKTLHYALMGKSIKALRYSRYKRGLRDAMRNPHFKAEVMEHEQHIQSVIGCG